ncbi:MAG TPA: hypothetical protein VIU61_09930 [Kofleriaceae bacterium]
MIRLVLLASIIAACGGDGGTPGTSGSISGMINDGTGAVTFEDDCEFFSTDNYLHVATTNDQTGVEVIWDPAIVDEPGMYTTSGIVPDITIAALLDGDILAAEGTVTFTVLESIRAVGTLQLTGSRLTGNASFDCAK